MQEKRDNYQKKIKEELIKILNEKSSSNGPNISFTQKKFNISKIKTNYKEQLINLRKKFLSSKIMPIKGSFLKNKKILNVGFKKVKKSVIAKRIVKKRLLISRRLELLEKIKKQQERLESSNMTLSEKKSLEKNLIKLQIQQETTIKRAKEHRKKQIRRRSGSIFQNLFQNLDPIVKTNLTAYYAARQKFKQKFKVTYWKKKYIRNLSFQKKIRARIAFKKFKKKIKRLAKRGIKINRVPQEKKKSMKVFKHVKPRLVRQSFRQVNVFKSKFRFKNYVFLLKQRKSKRKNLIKHLIKRNPRKFGRIFVNIRRRNYFLALTDRKNKIITKISSGSLGYKGRHRGKPVVGKRVAEYLASNATQKGFNILDIYFVNKVMRAFGEITKSLSSSRLFIVIYCFIKKDVMDLLW